MEEYNINSDEVSIAFNYIDTKKDGFIDRIEFIQALTSIPHPIYTIHNYIRSHKLTIEDIAYMMEFDIYNCPLEDTLNIKIDNFSFLIKMKMIDDKLDGDFLDNLFFSITNGKYETTINDIFKVFNIFNDNSYKELYSNRPKIESLCISTIPKCISFKEAKQNF